MNELTKRAKREGYAAGYTYALGLAKQADRFTPASNMDMAALHPDVTVANKLFLGAGERTKPVPGGLIAAYSTGGGDYPSIDEADAIRAQNESFTKAQAAKAGGGIREKALALLQAAKGHKAEIGAGVGGAGLGFGAAKLGGMGTPGAVGVGLGTGAAAAGIANLLKRYSGSPSIDAADKSLTPRG